MRMRTFCSLRERNDPEGCDVEHIWRAELLSRGSQVRVLPGAPFPKQFGNSSDNRIRGRSFSEKNDRSREFTPQLPYSRFLEFPRIFEARFVRRMDAMPKTHRDHRPGMPEVVTRPVISTARGDCEINRSLGAGFLKSSVEVAATRASRRLSAGARIGMLGAV
jgi:hypothetical protein